MLEKNINLTGRVVRLALGIILLAVVWIIYAQTGYISFGITLVGLFCVFQAAAGWCVARACGVKTKL
jgi:hypothetical protein